MIYKEYMVQICGGMLESAYSFPNRQAAACRLGKGEIGEKGWYILM